jgi:hypothetical protein
VVAKPGLDQRLPEQLPVCQKLADWEAHRHAAQAPVHWQFTTAKARRQLSGLSPVYSSWSTTSPLAGRLAAGLAEFGYLIMKSCT